VVLAAVGREATTAHENQQRRANLIPLGQIPGMYRPGRCSCQSLRHRTGDIETDHLNGEVVLRGRRAIPPANQLWQRLGRQLATGRHQPGALPAAIILGPLDKIGDPPSSSAPSMF
jgi:2-dehydropantoate 2-reductase